MPNKPDERTEHTTKPTHREELGRRVRREEKGASPYYGPPTDVVPPPTPPPDPEPEPQPERIPGESDSKEEA